jgi:hypothetical protein
LDTPERIATQGAATSPQWALAIRVIGDFVREGSWIGLDSPNFYGNHYCIL